MTATRGRLRSADWFDAEPKTSFIHRSWMRIEGVPDHAFDGRPVIGICNTWSELTPCNAHFRDLAEMAKRGVFAPASFKATMAHTDEDIAITAEAAADSMRVIMRALEGELDTLLEAEIGREPFRRIVR